MKKRFLLGLIVASLASSAFAAPPTYDGQVNQGGVFINFEQNSVIADMNVRFNPTAGHEDSFVSAHYNANGSSVDFFFYDSESSQILACYVEDSSPLFADVVDIIKNLDDGSRLWVNVNGGTCTEVGLTKSSNSQH